MPLTNTQKILVWGSAGLMATASALGVMFYSSNILGHSNIFTLSQPTTKVFGKSKNNNPYANGGRLPNLPDNITNNLSITQNFNKNATNDTTVANFPSNTKIMGKDSTKTLSMKQDEKYDNDYVVQSDFHNLSSGLNYEGSPAHRTTDGLVGPGYDHGIGIYHGELEASNLQDKSSPSVIKVTLPQKNEDNPIYVKYPNSAQLNVGNKKENLDTILEVNQLQYYYPWDGNSATSNNGHADNQNRSLVFSKDLYEGFMYNGLSGMHIQYHFFKAGTSTPVSVKGDYLEFRSINGLAPYKRHKSGGQDAWRNNEHFVRDLYYNHFPNFDDTVGESVQSGNNADPNEGEFVMPKRYNSQIRNENSPYSVNHMNGEAKMATGGLYASKYHNRYDHDIVFKIPSDVASFNNGSSVGYGNIQPFTTIYVHKSKPFRCFVDRKGHVQTNLKVGDSASKSQLSNNGKYSITQSQYNNIVDSKGNVTSNGLKYWEENVANCQVTPPGTPNEPNPTTSIKKTILPNGYNPNTGVESGSDKIRTQNIDNGSSNEGILKHPNQSYWYKITGNVPSYPSGNGETYESDYSNLWELLLGFGDFDDPINTGDYYHFNDNMPKDVSFNNSDIITKGLTDGVKASQDPDDPHHISFNLDRNGTGGSLVDNSGRPYVIYVKVKANHLPKINNHSGKVEDEYSDDTDTNQNGNNSGWHRYYNGDHNNGGTYASDKLYNNGDSDSTHTDYSNTVPVEIKRIRANIWHYDYNHDHNMIDDGYDDFFPKSDQPMGITNGIYNPSSNYFKNYRFDRFARNKDGSVKTNALLTSDKKPETHYWYAGTYHDINTISKNDSLTKASNGESVRYRFIYPSLDGKTEDADKLDPFATPTDLFGSDAFAKDIDTLNNAKNQDKQADGSEHVAMNANPDAGNYYEGGFDENRYMPYFIPRVSLNQNINPQTGKPESGANNTDAFRMVIDTDQAQHGLPFRIDMKSQNILYGRHYYDDFKNVNVEMNVSDADTGRPLYHNIRPLVGESSKALIHRGTYHKHSYTYSESPDGSKNYNNYTGRWHGYAEASALGDHYYNGNYDLDTRKHKNEPAYASGDKIPIHVSFKLKYGKYQGNNSDNYHNNPRDSDSAPEVDMQNFNTHAYISNRPTLASDDFGKNHVTGDSDQQHNEDIPKAQLDRATYIEPERTVEYGSNPGLNNPDGTDVRELKEQLSVTQPRDAVGKSGYGISANDFGLDYKGHLEASDYAHQGTNMQFAFPKVFNGKDSNISYSHDTRNHSLLGDNLLHVDPQYNRDYAGENYGLPDYLDTHDNNADDANADAEFEDDFPEQLNTGDFNTTYGFYPRSVTNEKSDGSNSNTDNGNVSLSNTMDSFPYNGTDKSGAHYGDSTSDLGKKYNLDTENNNTSHSDPLSLESKHTISADGQNERMFTPLFLQSNKQSDGYPDVYHRAFGNSDSNNDRDHRLGGNFFDIDEDRPIHIQGHQYISKNDSSDDQNYDELSLQPILTDPKNGLMQTPLSSPTFPTIGSKDTNNSNNSTNINVNGWLTDNLWSSTKIIP